MNKLFDLDGPILRFLNKMADLLWINILMILCCLPIITIGPAFSAAHYVCLKMYRNEEGYVTKEFFKAFKMNFKQGAVIGVTCLVLAAVFVTDFMVMNKESNFYIELPQIVHVLIMAAMILFLFFAVWVFAVQAKFINTTVQTMKNAFAISMMKFPQTIAMVVLYVCPWVLLWFTDFYLFPIVFMFGFSLPIYCSAALYSKFFEKLEENILARIAKEKAEAGIVDDEAESAFTMSDEAETGDGAEEGMTENEVTGE